MICSFASFGKHKLLNKMNQLIHPKENKKEPQIIPWLFFFWTDYIPRCSNSSRLFNPSVKPCSKPVSRIVCRSFILSKLISTVTSVPSPFSLNEFFHFMLGASVVLYPFSSQKESVT